MRQREFGEFPCIAQLFATSGENGNISGTGGPTLITPNLWAKSSSPIKTGYHLPLRRYFARASSINPPHAEWPAQSNRFDGLLQGLGRCRRGNTHGTGPNRAKRGHRRNADPFRGTGGALWNRAKRR